MKTLIAMLVFLNTTAFAVSIHTEEAQTVLVTNEGFLGGGRGSGVLLDETHVLTCAHMADSADAEFFIYTYPLGSVVKATVEYADLHADLMILKLAQPVVVTHFPVFEHHWTEGDPVTVIGNALGSMKWVVSAGVISGAERNYLLTDARINHGNSGGPWFDKDGSIIALTDWGISDAKNPGIAGGVSAATIEKFLESRDNKMAILGKLLGLGQ